MKRTWAWIFLSIFSLLAGGAGSQAAAQTPVTVWVSEHTSETRRIFASGGSSLKARFEREHPGVTLRFVWTSWDAFYGELVAAVASGSAPDLVQLAPEFLPAMVEEGLLASLQPPLPALTGEGDFYAPALQGVTYQGEIYGLPLCVDPQTLIYDTVPLVSSGYNARVLPQTWDEYREFVETMTYVNGAGVAIAGTEGSRLADYSTWLSLLWQAGGGVLDEEGRAAFDAGAGAQALAFLRELRTIVESVERQPEGPPPLASGTVASLFGGASDLRLLQAFSPDKAEFLTVGEPLKRSLQATAVQVDFLGLLASSPHPEEARLVLEFLARPEHQALYAGSVGYVPARKSAMAAAPPLSPNPHSAKLAEIVEKYGRATPLASRHALFDAYVRAAVMEAVRGEEEPEAALARARTRWEAWLGP